MVGLTLVWQQPSIAKKLASTGLDDYFKQDVLDQQKDDADRDGLKDSKEAELKTDPNKPDTDGDGLLDGEEVNTYKTNPLAMDTDGDKFSDATEVLTGHDPLRPANAAGTTATAAGQQNSGDSAAAGLSTVSQLLNGDTSTTPLTLQDFNANDLGDIASLLGQGNRAAIAVVDSDIKVIEVPEAESSEKVVRYFKELESIMLEVFSDELKDLDAAHQAVMAGLTSGQYKQLATYTKKMEIFTDRAFGVAVPVQAKDFHKLFLKTSLETCALGRSLQQIDSNSADSLLALSMFDQVEKDSQATGDEFNKLSAKYELGITIPALPLSTAASTK